MKRSSCYSAVMLLLLSVAPPAVAQSPLPQTGQGTEATVEITGNARARVRLAYPATDVEGGLAGESLEAAREIEQTLRDDLDATEVFNTQGPTELAVLTLTGDRAQDFEQYRSLGNEVVLLATIKQEGDKLVLDGWVYDLPSKQSILGKRFRGTLSQARLVAHYLADAMHYQFTGRPGLALTSIAFQSDRDGFQELYLMDYDGRNQRRISGHKSTSGYSDWSPAGDAIAYMSYFGGSPGLYYVELETGKKLPIYNEGTLNLSPSFSPDGKSIAFAHSEQSNVDVYRCDRVCQKPVRLTTSGAIDTNPSWSPDGQQLAFTSSRSGRPNVYVMNLDGSNVRRISFEGDYNDGASWQPGGNHIAYASREGNTFRIAATNLVDLKTQILTHGPDSYEEPCYSPDGRRILFTVRRGKQAQVYVMNADGGDWRQLTHEGNSSAADWSNFKSD
jgi:TolB protein